MTLEIVQIITLVITSIFLIAVGTYLVLVLQDIRQITKRARNVVITSENIVSALRNPATLIAGVLESLQLFKNFKNKN